MRPQLSDTAPRSRGSVISVRPMPMIVEDEASPPSIPSKSFRRSALLRGRVYGDEEEVPSPPYSPGNTDTTSTDRMYELKREAIEAAERRYGFRNQAWIARRGGWYRLGLAALILVVAIIGLAVGLVVALRNKASSSSSPPPAAGLFPAGSWTFTTALARASTQCTSDPATFRCYPFAAYSPADPDSSAAPFQWTIMAVNSYTYAVSSSPNPFVPQFSNLTLTLLDGDQYTERLTFNFSMTKAVEPSAPLSPSSSASATCYFNDTLMSATLWTRMRATYPANITAVANPVNASHTFAPWPFAVQVQQVAQAGPDCRDFAGQSVGSFAVDASPGAACGCYYANFELDGNNATAAAG